MPESDRTRAAHLQLLAVSWNFGWPIAAGVALGYWIDEKLGSSPAAALLFGIGALAASTWRLLLLSKREQAARHADELAHPHVELPREAPELAKRWDPETEQWVEDEGSGWDDGDSPGGTR
jgi:hypothetical protein